MTREQVKARFEREGRTIKSWADEHGFRYLAVIRVLGGYARGKRGESHRIAVKLGLK
jgi:gp16 family phage-associated protein